MSEYTPPLDDMRFVLEHVVGLNDLATHAEMGDINMELIESVLTPAAKLAAEVLAPINHSGDQEGTTLKDGVVTTATGLKEAYAEYRDGGWNGVPFPMEHGGQELPWLLAFPLQEMWQGANMAFGLCPLLNQGAVEAIHAHGSDAQKEEYLEKMISGEWTGTMNLTEPQAGSDLSVIRSKAEPAGDGTYKVFGQKIYITYGEHDMAENIIHLVLARLPDAPEGVKGISLFIVPKIMSDGTRNDVICTGIEHKLGIHASPTCTMQFGDGGGAVGYLVGKENEGLKYMFTMMNNARLSVGLQGVAIAEAAYQHALYYAKDREQGTKLTDRKIAVKIVDHADVKRQLLTMKSQIDAMRALTYEAALHLDLASQGDEAAQAKVDLLTPVVKACATDMAVDVTSIGVQIHGGMGFVEETGAAQFYRDARILPIYEGTNGIQAADLAFRKILRDQGSAVKTYLSEIELLVRELDQMEDAKFFDLRHGLDSALEALTGATSWILEAATKDLDCVAASSVPYLNCLGHVAGGAMMIRSAMIAHQQLKHGQGDETFLKNKIESAHFYVTHILPKAEAHAQSVKKGSDSVLAYKF